MIALARTYRPRQFADLISQDHVAAALRGAVAQGRVAHGYLFAGPRGVGKTTAARILAMALNCERRAPGAGEPCGACDSCTRISAGAANLDVVELDAASNRGVDDARDLRERAMYAASAESRSKVYIVDEAHMLTREAWNALLKILEEPPPRVVFVFATTEPQKIASAAAPILSRLQRFDFRRIGPHAIVGRLRDVARQEGITADDDALHLIAKSADGGMRDALSLLDQVVSFGGGPVTAERVRAVLGLIPEELYADMLRCIVERDAAGVFRLVEQLLDAGADLGEFVNGAGETLRAVLLVGVGGQPEGLTEGLLALVRDYAARLPPGDVVRLLTILAEAEEGVRRGGNARLAVEVLLLRWAMIDRTVEIGQVLDALQGGPTAGRPDGRTDPVPPPTPRAPDESSDRPAAGPSDRPIKGPLSVDHLRAVWPDIVAAARAKSPLLGSLLAEARVAGLDGGVVVVQPAHGAHAEGLERQRELIAQLISRHVSVVPRVRIATGGGGGGGGSGGGAGPGGGAAGVAMRPARLTEEGANAERLKVLRGKDPSLGAAVDALDLELLN
ncbi:MAG: DNA polymerase III subunit gamma/tau [Gemmatimonadales bacterium]